MQIVFFGDNLHETSKPICWDRQVYIVNLLSAELAYRAVKVKEIPDGSALLKFLWVSRQARVFIYVFQCYIQLVHCSR